jgi:hypothetical protein
MILQYLVEHPEAKDTVEGIINWWLPTNSIIWEIGKLQEVLDFLVSRGWVIEREIIPSTKIYSVNSNCLDEINSVLRKIINGEESGI